MYFMDAREKIGLVLGNGHLPVLLLEQCHKPVCALIGDSPSNIHEAKCSQKFSIAQVSQMIEFFKKNGVKKICIAGGVVKPKITLSLIKDVGVLLLFKLLTLPNTGDDHLLNTLLSYIENKGFEVISASDIIPNLLTKAGYLTARRPSATEMRGIHLGASFLHDISKYDISQACVVDGNCIIALEGLEGTARMIARTKELNKGGAVLVKMPKKDQTLKIDMPAIGIDTVKQCADANIQGIAIKAETTIVLNKEEVFKLANERNIFIYSIA